MSQRRSRKVQTPLEAQTNALVKLRLVEGAVSLALTLARYGSVVAVAYLGYRTIDVLAGKTTLADIGIGFLANVQISTALAWGVGVGGAWYGKRQNRLRKDTIERLQGRIQHLERQHDPQRSSSNLTRRGDTRQEDRL
ncbi:MAG: hypothetical protein JSS44_08970 [Proteobacteria bacterium]|nr:hypothetical protein [Pseudomonadota bacterium]MBS0461767.1 hypothetical protein [Pseudomonadota bacterium]MBS0499369.1 hypothetical protein [Pseudomonadota bacterium]